jgi:hypothetical protein
MKNLFESFPESGTGLIEAKYGRPVGYAQALGVDS